MKKAISSFTYMFIGLCLLSIAGCRKNAYNGNGPSLELNANVKISSFSIGSINGIISDSAGTINLSFPFGYNRTAVAPVVQVAAGATVSPASGTTMNFTTNAKYTVTNGNIYSTYTVIPTEQPAILSFVVAGVTATIDEVNRIIKATIPVNSNLAALAPTITLATGATISPASGTTVNFTNPVVYTVKKDTATVNYKVTVVTPETVAFIGVPATVGALTDPEELAAWNWLSSTNPLADYVSLTRIQNGTVNLSKYSVIWWHYDESQSLPTIALSQNVIQSFKTYYANGGNFLLTTFAASYVDPLGIVPAGMGPNNAFGGAPAWSDNSYDWGISYYGYASHPAFAGLPQAPDKPYPTVYLLAHGTFRLNNTDQWHIGSDWGGFATPAIWRQKTGGLDLGSTEWDQNHTSQVTMAEFPKTSAHGGTIVIAAGAYTWYAYPDPSNLSNQPANSELPNIQKLTSNVLGYLSK